MADLLTIARRPLIRQHGIAHCAPRHASWLATQLWPKQYRQSFGASGHPSRLRAGSSVRSRKKRRNKCRTNDIQKPFYDTGSEQTWRFCAALALFLIDELIGRSGSADARVDFPSGATRLQRQSAGLITDLGCAPMWHAAGELGSPQAQRFFQRWQIVHAILNPFGLRASRLYLSRAKTRVIRRKCPSMRV